jgi:segregation and condensation protein B
MSLKAKIEAVIYAAEEPVTLAQLTALFGAEVSEALTAARQAEPEVAPETASVVAESGAAEMPEFAEAENNIAASEPATPSPEAVEQPPVPEAIVSSEADSAPATESGDSESTADEAQPAASPTFADEKVDEKKAARQRDREIRDELKRLVNELMEEYSQSDRGMEIREVAGGYRVATKPEYHDAVRSFVKSLKPPMKLSLQALETLAVIAYKQPVTAPEVSEIRGVDSGGVLGSLISRKLITTAGRKQVIGRPILYKTTKEFLLRFGLKDVSELPSIEEFEKMAGEIEIAEETPDQEPPFEGDLPFTETPGEIEVAQEESAQPQSEEAVEVNAGEAGISVGSPEPETSMTEPSTEVVALDAQVPEIVTPAEDIELVPAAHPADPVEGE